MNSCYVYVGGYTYNGLRGGSGRGIYRIIFDRTTGQLDDLMLVADAVDPAFIAIHPNGRFLYSVCVTDGEDGNLTGGVSAFAICPEDGRLLVLNEVLSGGIGPCHLIVDHSGNNVLVAHYGSGSVSCIRIRPNGELSNILSVVRHRGSSIIRGRQEEAHCHSINVSPDNRFSFVADLGCDKLVNYDFDAGAGLLWPRERGDVQITPGSGPRHLAFHPNGKYCYLINEISLDITCLEYDSTMGEFKTFQTVSAAPMIERLKGSLAAEICVHPLGSFVYVSIRGMDAIILFRIEKGSGVLVWAQRQSSLGFTPRNFCIDVSGKFMIVANQDSNSVVVFSIDQEEGVLSAHGSTVTVPSPSCVRMVVMAG